MGPNPLTANPFRESQMVPLGSWREKAGLTLTATSEPDLIAMGTSGFGMKWDHGGTTTDQGTLQFFMPFEFGGAAVPKADIRLIVVARKLDAASDENADLAIQASLAWFTPGIVSNPRITDLTKTAPTLITVAGAFKTLTTPAKVLLAAAVVAADNTGTTGFASYELDLGARVRAESKTIQAGDMCFITIAPNEAVGSADMDLEIMGAPLLIIRREQQIAESQKLQRDVVSV